MRRAYYNEIDPFAAQWLRNLIAAGHIAPGDVDERSIVDVRPDELAGYTQCHFFAGIGGWSLAARLAGWPDDRPVWTGSCPCQPFSAAGARGGFADERHLWPHFHWLIQQCRPAIVFGEQVASKDGLAWLDLVQADLEGSDYATGAADLCAAGVGAPHIRQRLYWLAHNQGDGCRPWPALGERAAKGSREAGQSRQGFAADGRPCVAPGDASGAGLAQRERNVRVQRGALGSPEGQTAIGASDAGELADAGGQRCNGQPIRLQPGQQGKAGSEIAGNGPACGFWSRAEWIDCRDGKARPVEPGTFPLAHGVSARVGRLRAYGNAIVPQVAAEFIGAYLDAEGGITA